MTDADRWNEAHPKGTRVMLTNDHGDVGETRTRARAWMSCGIALVRVRGREGGYRLDRLTAIEEEDADDD